MLTQLTIENVAVISQATIDFSSGLQVFTGETGAGKSILIDSLSAILGFRTSKELVRTGAKKAYIRGVFTQIGQEATDFLAENHLPLEDDTLILTREISAEGKNLCKVCGMTVNVSTLRALGDLLVDIHGQQDNLLLTDLGEQLAFLDAFGHLEPLKEAYKAPFKEMCRLIRMIQNLNLSEAQKQQRIGQLAAEIDELEAAALSVTEKQALQQERARQYHAEKLVQDFQTLLGPLNGFDQQSGVVEQLESGIAAAGRLAEFYPALGPLGETYQEIFYQLEDIRSQLCNLSDDLWADPQKLGEIEDRLVVYDRFEARYGGVQEALTALEQAKEELDSIRLSDEKIVQLKQEYEAIAPVVKQKAADLTAARMAAGERLADEICARLQFMNMPAIRIAFVHQTTKLTSKGQDQMELMMSANQGEEMRPLAKVASGGELSRVMLAIKSVLGGLEPNKTQVFDEIDAGISGAAAQKVGVLLGRMGTQKQVLCVTHLAQIACQAHQHLCISKQESEGRTFTHVTRLDKAGQIDELARIISGTDSQTARQTAAEMLQSAKQL